MNHKIFDIIAIKGPPVTSIIVKQVMILIENFV